MKHRLLLFVVFVLCLFPLSGFASHTDDRTMAFDADCLYFTILDIDGNILLTGREEIDGVGRACARLIRLSDGEEIWHQHYDTGNTQIQQALRFSGETAVFVIRHEDFSSSMYTVDLRNGEAVFSDPLPKNFLCAYPAAEENAFYQLYEMPGLMLGIIKSNPEGKTLAYRPFPHFDSSQYPGPFYAIPQGGGYLWSTYLTRLNKDLQVV